MNQNVQQQTPRPSRVPLIFSALVYPGSGQFMQRRPAAGAVFVAAFTVAFAMLVVSIFGPMLHNLRAALQAADGGFGESFIEIPIPRILGLFGLTLLVYIANVMDVLRHYRRAALSRQKSFDADGRAPMS